MLKSDGTFNSEGSAALALVSAIRNLGIEVRASVTAETQNYHRITAARETAQREYRSAVLNLGVVNVDKFDDARNAVLDAASRLHAVTQGADNVLIDAASRRLTNQVFDAASQWEAEVVEQFNEIVDSYQLNEVAEHLPNFGDPKSFNVLSLNRLQGDAVERWRSAADELHPRWSAYRRLAASRGHELGPVNDADSFSTNLFTSCALGDPGTWRRTEGAAHQLTKIAAGVDSVKAYAAITPFIVPALAGYPLHLHTLAAAAAVRRQVQGTAAFR